MDCCSRGWKEEREWEKEKERERMAGSYSHENDGHAWDESHSNGVPTRKVRVSLGER